MYIDLGTPEWSGSKVCTPTFFDTFSLRQELFKKHKKNENRNF